MAQPRLQLCGRLAVTWDGRRTEGALPARQGRLLFVHLVTHRNRPATRDGLGELDAAERSGRRLVELAPFRESGHRLLIESLAARGEVAEALLAYEHVRTLLRDELGVTPHARLLTGTPPPPAARG